VVALAKRGAYTLFIWGYNCVPEKKVRRVIGSGSVSILIEVMIRGRGTELKGKLKGMAWDERGGGERERDGRGGRKSI